MKRTLCKRLQFFKKRIASEIREKSEYLPRETNNIHLKTDTSKFNRDKKIEKIIIFIL